MTAAYEQRQCYEYMKLGLVGSLAMIDGQLLC